MKTIREKAEAVLAITFSGLHNVPSTSGLKPFGNGFAIDVQPSQLSTFDFAGLTRLVIAAHDECVRVSVMNSGPRQIKLTFHDRKRSGEHSYERHPTIEQALESYRMDHPNAGV